MPKKFIECVREVKKKSHGRYNPYAVCRVSTGYYGTTHDIGMLHPIHHKKHQMPKLKPINIKFKRLRF